MRKAFALACLSCIAMACGNTPGDDVPLTRSMGGFFDPGADASSSSESTGSTTSQLGQDLPWHALTCEDVAWSEALPLFAPAVGTYSAPLVYEEDAPAFAGVSGEPSVPMTMTLWLNEEPQPRIGCGEDGHYVEATMLVQTEDGALNEELVVRLVRSRTRDSYSFSEVVPRLNGTLSIVEADETLSFEFGGTFSQLDHGTSLYVLFAGSFINEAGVTFPNWLFAIAPEDPEFSPSDDAFGEQRAWGGAGGAGGSP